MGCLSPLEGYVLKSLRDDIKVRTRSANTFVHQKFTKNNKIFKVPWKALQQLETEGKIRIYTPEDVAEIISQHPKKKIRRKANDIKAAMEKNGEILIEGQIPGNVIYLAK